MDKRLKDILSGKADNYILPFFWQDSNHRERIGEQIAVISQSGVKAFCVESRTHEDFCGETSWQDMDIILEEAKKHHMQVWLLDDKNFPTGYANGAAEQNPKLRRYFLRERHVDIMGPLKNCTLLLEESADELLCVCGWRRGANGENLEGEPVDFTQNIRGRWVGWDVPPGCWRVFFLYKSRDGALPGQELYIDMLNHEAVQAFLDAVYLPHYQRYKALFGNTFAGFFSDEPSFGNYFVGRHPADYGTYNRRLGMPGLALPWNIHVMDSLNENAIPLASLPLLWYPAAQSPEVRLAYMDSVTQLYRDCFSRKVGDWCRGHGVEYIGHVIEDMNAHARLGCGAGHFYRALEGQNMSGIDIVLHQVLPGFAHTISAASCSSGVVDPAFFHYVLGKMAASLAHISPQMRGRAMCEVFGAYGWAEGIPMMKWLTDFLLVRGINYFVPHAFSPTFPNPDCPPHFDAWGNDPQFAGFTKLMDYTNKAAHLLSGGVHQGDVALLYHAESEWMAPHGDAMLVQEPAKMLYDDHIDYDILPADTVCASMTAETTGVLCVGEETFKCLIIPAAPFWPDSLLHKLKILHEQGADILFINSRPKGTENIGCVVPLAKLTSFLRTQGAASMYAEACPLLRIFHTRRENTSVFMLFNESVTEAANCTVSLPINDDTNILRLDLLTNSFSHDAIRDNALQVNLQPYQSEIILCGELEGLADIPTLPEWTLYDIPNHLVWDIQLVPTDKTKENIHFQNAALFNITATDRYPDFTGTMRYRTNLQIAADKDAFLLDFGMVGQTCRLKINGKDMGMRICLPYTYALTGVLTPGDNQIELIVQNTLAHQVKDSFSTFIPMPPSGLTGPLKLWVTNTSKSIH